MTPKERAAMQQALGALVRAEAMYGQPNADIQTALREALAEPQITTPDVCGEVCARAKLCYGCNKDLEEANAKYGEQAEQEPVAQQDSDDRRLLREVLMLCEATEELEPTNEFMRGRIFEAKGIRRGIGTWYQDTFCGRSYMCEPVLNAAPVEPVKAEQEPVAETVGDVTNTSYVYVKALVEKIPFRTKLYAAPVRTKDLTDDEIYPLYPEGPMCDKDMIDFARAVIAADREKNNANNNT